MATSTKPRRVRVHLRLSETLARKARAVAAKQRRTFTSLTEEALEAALRGTK